MKIRPKIIIISFLLALIPVTALGVISYMRATEAIHQSSERSYMQLSSNIANSLQQNLNGYLFGVESIAENVDAREILIHPEYDPFLRALFSNYVDNYPAAYQIYMGTYDKGMRIEPDFEFDDSYDATKRSWYIRANETGVSGWTDIYQDAVTGNYSVAGSSPVFYEGDFIGAVSTSLDLNIMSEEFTNLTVGLDGYAVVVDYKSRYILHPDMSLVGTSLTIDEINQFIESGTENGVVHYTWNGEDKAAYIVYLPEPRWYVLATMPMSEINATTDTIRQTGLIVSIIALIVAAITSYFFANSITKPITRLVEAMSRVENGDMTVQYTSTSKDEMGTLSRSFSHMVGNVRQLLQDASDVTVQVLSSSESLAANAEETSASTEEVSRTVEEIASGASEQAKDAEEAARKTDVLDSKLSELSSNSKVIADNAGNVQLAGEKGATTLSELRGVTDLNIASSNAIADAVHDLEEKSQSIGAIIETISSIADQTNLLALNASIEAARAGEHGKGFAVVADEIRKLAEESSNSADQIGNLIKMIQSQTSSAVSIVDDVKSNAEKQFLSVKDMDVSFSEISSEINDITAKIRQVDSFIEEIVNAKDEIVGAITNISSVSEETAASSEEVSATTQQQSAAVDAVAEAAAQLSELSKALNEQIGKFSI